MRWRVVPASVSGSSHLRQGAECQDASSDTFLTDGSPIVVVCDGAGSAGRAAEGSRLAADASTSFLRECLEKALPTDIEGWERTLTACLRHVRSVLVKTAEGQASPGGTEGLSEFATTLLIAVATRDWLVAAQVGDGAIVSRDASGALSVLTVQGESEYVNETTFMTSTDFLKRAHLYVSQQTDVTGLAVLSDGLQLLALKYSDNSAHAPFFVHMFAFAENPDAAQADLEEFLRSDKVCERTDDDKTLVLAVRT